MHKHTVLFNFKDEVPETERKRVIDLLRSLKAISVCKSMMVEKNKLAAGPKAPFEWILIADFANDDDRQIYEKDPLHVKVIKTDWVPAAKDYIIADVNY